MAIPPAWRRVWISPDAQGHIQATGRDAKGRKQYRYHPKWREWRDADKYERMVAFGQALPRIRRRVRADLRENGLSRNRVLAAVVRLLELSCVRVGNEEYARDNGSYGLTTMQDRHVQVKGARICFEFRGKGGKQHQVDVAHPIIARIIRRCQDLPGQDLFQYIDDAGVKRDVSSGDVNQYLLEVSGRDFTAKDFRTWIGTVLAALALKEFKEIDSRAAAKRNVVRAIEQVAERLGNTPAICKKCYVHPGILESYLDGTLIKALRKRAEREMRKGVSRLPPEEAAVLALLRQRLKESEDENALEKKLARSLRQARQRRARSGGTIKRRSGKSKNHQNRPRKKSAK